MVVINRIYKDYDVGKQSQINNMAAPVTAALRTQIQFQFPKLKVQLLNVELAMNPGIDVE